MTDHKQQKRLDLLNLPALLPPQRHTAEPAAPHNLPALTTTTTTTPSAAARQKRDSKVENGNETDDAAVLMLARAEVANDLLYNDPKRVAFEGGGLTADGETLRSLVDVRSPTTATAQLLEADFDADSSQTPDQQQQQRKKNKSNRTSYRVYPEGDERGLPEFIMESQTMDELDATTGDWEASLEALGDAGDFWRSVIDDAEGLRKRAPLHLAAKIRAGIPGRMRGPVWQTLTQARSTYLQTVYTQLIQEYSPHERVIRRDLTRTFPKVPVFKTEGGEGQLRLFRILKAYSLYDAEVGYCQGLGFIIGPLIMNMGECASFCVLVRLMETYDLRGMFTEDMAGLHLRLYQFQALATEIAPTLMAHLEAHGVLPAMYVPSWFLSLFAYTMPLSFVLRAMDVIVAEGAPESIIRIGVALLQRNAEKLMQQEDFESAMGVLNSGLYDDEANPKDRPGYLLQEAARLSAVVTRDRLDALERQYCKDQGVVLKGRPSASISSDAATARPIVPASSSNHAIMKFLGWPWSKEPPPSSSAATTPTASTPTGGGKKVALPLLTSSISLTAANSDDSVNEVDSDDTAVAAAYARARNGGRISPRILEMTDVQRQRSLELRDQMIRSLQTPDEDDDDLATVVVPATTLGSFGGLFGTQHQLDNSAATGGGGGQITPGSAVSCEGKRKSVSTVGVASELLGDSAWRHEVLEPLQQQLHDARVTSDTHRDALASLQAELEVLRTELVMVKTVRAEVAAENERLHMEVRKADADRLRMQETVSDAKEQARQSENALIKTRMELAEADEERALLVRQLENLRKFIAETTPHGIQPPLDDSAKQSSSSSSNNRFSISSFASNWSAIRGAITSPRQSMQQDPLVSSPPPMIAAVTSTIPSPSGSLSSTSAQQQQNQQRHSVIPMAKLHRSKTSPQQQ
ncbi:hypothetical protein EV175_000861 [Coemansia sp. RSA 1933]|nr:hypothetical protein EV175_000861 [Coemansia sp. RSA 1933]